MKVKYAVLYIIFFISKLHFAFGNEGMWLPIFLSQLNEKEMRAAGMKLKASDIYDINKKYLGVNWYRNHLSELTTITTEQTNILV